MGEVWLAEHITQRVPVAIKVLDSSKPHSVRALKSFRKEVRASAALDHPNIIKVFDYGIIDPQRCPESGSPRSPGSPYYVMEYARGGSLNKLAHTLSWPQIRDVLLTILRALSHAHARGVIHRDLKPGNILLRQGSQALDDIVLSDFGLAWAIRDGESNTTSQARLIGTPAYMAPEQINNQLHHQGPWTDLYALGCLTWLLVHGKTPYGVEPTDDVLRSHIAGKLPPWEPIISVPDSLRSWLKVMLASDPGSRFGFAATAARELYHLDSLSGASAPLTLWEESEPSPPHQNLSGVGLGLYELRPVPLVGRHKERRQLWAEFHATLDTRSPRIILMRGGAGVGKSRLAQWLIQRVHERGLALPMIAGHEPNPQAFDGIAKMLAHEMRSLDLDRPKALKRAKSHLKRWRTLDDTPEILEQDALTLTDILHPLRGSSSSTTLGLLSDQWRARQLTLLRHLDRVTRAHPVVVWLDDVQWASEALSLVKAAMTVWDKPLPVLFVMTLREEAHSPQRAEYHQLEELLDMRLAIRQLEIEPMEPLTHNALLKKLLPLDEQLTSEVERRADGNPLFTIQLIGDWVQRGVLRADGNRWALAPGEDLSIPNDIHQLWRQRIDQVADMFDREERLRAEIALENAAVLGRDILPQEWIDACALMGVSIPDGLIERMIKHRMARASDVGWSFYHEMLRESLQLLAQKSGRMREHHRACAMMLRRRYGRERGHVSERLAYHLLGAGLHDEALEPMLDALNNLRIQGEFVRANKLLARWQAVIDQLRLCHGDPRQIKGLLARAHLHISAGELDEARRSLDAATQHAELNHDPRLLACVYLSRGLLARKRGATQLTLDELFKALELFREVSTSCKDLGRCLASLGEVHVTLGMFDEAKLFLLEAIEIFRALRSHDALGQALMSLGEMFYENNNTTQGARLIQEAIAQFQHQSNRTALALCYNLQGEIARKRGELDEAARYYQRSLALMRAIGSRDAIYPSVNLGFTMLERSDYVSAAKILGPLTTELEAQERWAYLACTQLGLMCCDAAMMNWASWDERFDDARAHIAHASAVEPDAASLAERTGTQCAALGHSARARRAFELALDQRAQLNQPRACERLRQKLAAL